MECIIFRGKKVPLVLARKFLVVTGHVLPLNKFHRDLYLAVFSQDLDKRRYM